MPQYSRAEIREKLQEKLNKGTIILGAGAGTGISAKFEEKGGADIIMVFNSGRYRMSGFGSLAGWLAYGNANDISIEMGERYILPVVNETPVICGLNATDPTWVMDKLLEKVINVGFSGINNFPTIGLIDGKFRKAIENTGISYNKEVEMIKLAHELDIFTMVYAFTPEEAKKMANAGCDVLIAHVGLTAGGSIGAQESLTLEDAGNLTKEMFDAAKSINSETFVFCHGGPIVNAMDVNEILKVVPVEGFVGASSIERLPVEIAIQETTASFKNIKRL